MDFELVSGSESVLEGGGVSNRPAPLTTYTERFEELCPYYLSIGMTYEQYWEQDCEAVKYFRRAAAIKQEIDNQQLWLQGLYFYEALCCVAPVLNAFAKKGAKPVPYRSEPYPFDNSKDKLSQEKRQENNDSKAKAVMEMFMIHNNKKFDSNGGESSV